MKPSSFMKFCAVMAGVIVPPVPLFADTKDVNSEKKGFKVDNEKDRFDKSILLFEGDTFHCKVATNDMEGDVYFFESFERKNGWATTAYPYTQTIADGKFVHLSAEERHQFRHTLSTNWTRTYIYQAIKHL